MDAKVIIEEILGIIENFSSSLGIRQLFADEMLIQRSTEKKLRKECSVF